MIGGIGSCVHKPLTPLSLPCGLTYPTLPGVFGGRQQTHVLLRAVVLMAMRRRADQLRQRCHVLPPGHHTIDEEVAETVKRRELQRLLVNRRGLAETFNCVPHEVVRPLFPLAADGAYVKGRPAPHRLPPTPHDEHFDAPTSPDDVPPLFASPDDDHNSATAATAAAAAPAAPVAVAAWGDGSDADIYACFREMGNITGRFSAEAAALRRPMHDRDTRLIRNGFMRQARAEFLDLRKMVQGGNHAQPVAGGRGDRRDRTQRQRQANKSLTAMHQLAARCRPLSLSPWLSPSPSALSLSSVWHLYISLDPLFFAHVNPPPPSVPG